MATFRSIALSGVDRAAPQGGLPSGALWSPDFEPRLRSLPAGEQHLWGVPFVFRTGDLDHRWLWLDGTSTDAPPSIPLGDAADYVVFAHFSIPSPDGRDPASPAGQPWRVVLRPGEHLADYLLVFADGTEHRTAIRRRFEVNDLVVTWGQAAAAARPHRTVELLRWRGPHDDGKWGRNQVSVDEPSYDGEGTYWLHALAIPHPERPLASVRLEAIAGRIGIGAITSFQGPTHPLRHRPLETIRVSVVGPGTDREPHIEVDLGVVGHRRAPLPTGSETWLSEMPGWSEPHRSSPDDDVLVEIAANEAATLDVEGHRIPMADVYADGRAGNQSGTIRVELLPAPELRVKGVVVDGQTGRPTPARIHLHTADGRYLPPYGHRREINDRWFEDFGSDLLIGATPYAYVDGSFELLLPPGDVFVEVVKGFEHRPLRQRVRLEAGQTELRLTIERPLDWRSRGWVTADTHVHFLSPQTAWLQAQAEGVNVLNLLAAQWGDLFTNVGDLTGAVSGVSADDTIVWVGTENRQHFLGHMNLLGGRGSPVVPMSAGGPNESYIGDPVWSTLADWADANHERDGIVVIPHFPAPYCEVVADVALGKVDAVEIADLSPAIETYAMREWYRLLNAGFRVAAVGGTDKMSADIPVGGIRTYARIGPAELSFASWADAIRAGRTFTTSGPLIDLTVDGQGIGDELRLGRGGGAVEIVAEATCLRPLDALEIVHNGRVVAREEVGVDPYRLRIATTLRVAADGWIAARCVGPSAIYRPVWARWPVTTAAHTSPVYIVGTGVANDAADLAYLVTMIDGGLTWLDTLATWDSPTGHARARSRFLDARTILTNA